MRKTLTLVLLVAALITGAAQAQVSTPRWYFAAAYNDWSIQSQGTNVFTFTSPQICQIANPYSPKSYTFSTNAPVLINDLSTPTNNEIVTPSTVTTSTPCGFTASVSHSHSNFLLQSGTAGLQEAINAATLGSTTHLSSIVLDPVWWTVVAGYPSGTTGATIIAAAAGSTKVSLVDITTNPYTWYGWNGSAYVALGGPGGLATANGASIVYGSISENMTLATGGATTDSTANLLPANSWIDGVVFRVTTTINNVTSWQPGDASTVGRFGAQQTSGQLTAAATFVGNVFDTSGIASATTGAFQSSAAKLRITTAGGTQNTTGAIRVTVFYHTLTPPTS